MKALKSARIVAASLGVLAFGAFAASPAMAFDNLEWNWQKDVKEKVDIDAKIKLDIKITGMVEVEKLQIFLGDAKAESYVHDIDNNPIRTTKYVEVPGGGKDDEHNGGGYDPKPHVLGYNDKGGHDYDPCKNTRGKDNCGGGNHEPEVKYKEVRVPLDATKELPIVLSSATAVGNNQSITSDVPIFLHDGQFVADVKDHRDGNNGGCDSYDKCQPVLTASGLGSNLSGNYGGFDDNHHYNQGPDGNLHTTLAGLFLIGSVIPGLLTHADIHAESKVWDIRNASVDSSATAVANNISVNLASDVDQSCTSGCADKSNHVVIADITQFALANVSAKSSVYDVSANGYDHMRQLTTDTLSPREGDPGYKIAVPTPWISSVATAVGNNVSINVGRDMTPTPKTTAP